MVSYRSSFALALLASLLVYGAAPKRPFSHKYHVTQVATCQGCHTDAEQSKKADDNILPISIACASCHDEVTIKEPRKTPVANFSHELHSKVNPGKLVEAALKNGTWLGPAAQRPVVNTRDACVACHHDIEKSEAITDKDGLAHYPRMADCLVCHSKISPPESCKQCHDASAMTLRPSSHVLGFLETHAVKDKIEKTGCASCHGKVTSCKGCH